MFLKGITLDLITHLLLTTERSYDRIVTFIDRLSKYMYFVQCTSHVTAPEVGLNVFSNCGNETWDAVQVDF